MNLQINGEAIKMASELTVTQLLSNRNVEMPDMVSVELNGNILNRQMFDSTIVRDGDRVEFLYFMGGGQRLKRETI
jgi:sulfur carrier protein